MKVPTCVLLITANPYFRKPVESLLRKNFEILAIVHSGNGLSEEELAALKPDYAFSFLSEIILRGPLLKKSVCINFHPSPPKYRGRGGASFSIYNGDEFFGATAHMMDDKIDHGQIISTYPFPSFPEDNCESLFAESEMRCFSLFREIVHRIKTEKFFYFPNMGWEGEAVTRKDFTDWLVVDHKDEEKLKRKIKASEHSQFPGPYIIVAGRKFELSKG